MEQFKLVGIAGLEVVRPPEKLKTVLGSCVGIVMHDPRTRVTGLAHAILPTGDEAAAELGKYADQAVDNLVVRMVGLGANKKTIQARLVGGATMFGKPSDNSLGVRNAEEARRRLSDHGIPVVAEALGGGKGRKLFIDAESGKTTVEAIGELPCEI